MLFEDAVVLGAENDTVLYPAEPTCLGITLPFCVIGRTVSYLLLFWLYCVGALYFSLIRL